MKVTRINNCLICYKSLLKLVKNKDSSNIKLSEQYTVIFAVRNLLNISSDTCATYLKKCGNPTSWVSFCSTCRCIVEEAELISSQLNKLTSKLKDLQSQAKSSILKSYINVDSLPGLNSSKAKITDQIRLQVAQKNEDARESAIVLQEKQDPQIQFTSVYNHEAGHETTEPMNLLTIDEIKIEDLIDVSVVSPKCSSEDDEDWQADGGQDLSDSDYIPEDGSDDCKKIKEKKISVIKGKNEASDRRNKIDSVEQSDQDLRSHSDTGECTISVPKGVTKDNRGGSTISEDGLGSVQAEIQKPFKCDSCNRRFLGKQNLKTHIRTQHGPDLYECKHCPSKFKEWRRMKKHGLKVHFEELQRPKKVPKRRIYTCQDCGKRSQSKTHHESHMRSHSGERPYMCELCSATFTSMTNMRYHQSSKHFSELNLEPYVCPECGKAFASKFNLLAHSKTQHLKAFSLSCPICNAGFIVKSQLEYHMTIHSGEKPQMCPICKKKFRIRSSLTHHMRIHSDERPFACRTCGKTFRESSARLRHENIHSDMKDWKHECKLCHKKFPVRNYLYIHMRSHNTTSRKKKCDKVTKPSNESGNEMDASDQQIV